jgi:hypothetical protein
MNRGRPVGFAVGIAQHLAWHSPSSQPSLLPIAPTKDLVLLEDAV